MDVAYIENWSLLLDLKIIARTVGVVLAGTGS
jgi:lipopolysaccharide/colanic/teichoic acid biosynthesis glycosyltransferase